jgi:hypothetical protein
LTPASQSCRPSSLASTAMLVSAGMKNTPGQGSTRLRHVFGILAWIMPLHMWAQLPEQPPESLFSGCRAP